MSSSAFKPFNFLSNFKIIFTSDLIVKPDFTEAFQIISFTASSTNLFNSAFSPFITTFLTVPSTFNCSFKSTSSFFIFFVSATLSLKKAFKSLSPVP